MDTGPGASPKFYHITRTQYLIIIVAAEGEYFQRPMLKVKLKVGQASKLRNRF